MLKRLASSKAFNPVVDDVNRSDVHPVALRIVLHPRNRFLQRKGSGCTLRFTGKGHERKKPEYKNNANFHRKALSFHSLSKTRRIVVVPRQSQASQLGFCSNSDLGCLLGVCVNRVGNHACVKHIARFAKRRYVLTHALRTSPSQQSQRRLSHHAQPRRRVCQQACRSRHSRICLTVAGQW